MNPQTQFNRIGGFNRVGANACRLAAVALVGLAASSSAFAWKHTQVVWNPSTDFPYTYQVADDGTPETDCEETVPPGYCRDVAALGFEAWKAAPCADLSFEYQGVCPNRGFSGSPGVKTINFNDVNGELEPGVLAAALTIPGQLAFIRDGIRYRQALDSDIVFNDNVIYTTHMAVEQGQCSNAFDMRSTMTHEIGHSLGMGHSCENGEPCATPKLRNATMFWTGGPCDVSTAVISEDDIEGITALYGPYATFRCSNELVPGAVDTTVYGEVGFELRCIIESEAFGEISNVRWAWGDGTIDNGTEAAHVYDRPGNYSIQVDVNGDREVCGPDGWSYSFRRIGYVTVCGVPDANFTWKHIDGLTYQMLNETDVSVYGCIFDIAWDVYRAGESTPFTTISAWEPQFTFPEAGSYRVVLNVGGPAGTGAAELTFDVLNTRGEGYGCSTSGAVGFGTTGAFALLGLVGLRRRRA